MSGFDTTVDVLMDSRHRDAPALLGHILSRGDMRLRERLVDRLLATNDGRRQSLLVRHFDDLGSRLERKVCDAVGRLGPGLRAAMAARDPRMQLTVVRLVRDTGDLSLAYLVGEAGNSEEPSVRGQAVDLLWRWAVELRRREMSVGGPPAIALGDEYERRRTFVLEGLQRAFAMRWAGEAPRIVKAAAMLADDHAAWFWGAMGIPRDVRRRTLLRTLAERFEPEMFSFAVRALARDSIGGEVVPLVARPLDRPALETLLGEFNRQGPISAAAARRVRVAPWLGAGEATLEVLGSNLVATALALAVAGQVPRKRLAILCRGIAVNHTEIEARRVALDTLAQCGEAADEELLVVACTAATSAAATAALHLSRRGMLPGEEETVTAAAQLVDNVVRDWSALSSQERREVARGLTPLFRRRPELLRPHLDAGAATRRAAVHLVRLAQTADVFAEELGRLARDPSDTRIQSAALAAAAESAAQGVADLLEEALGSWDARVRANAVEAFDRRGAEPQVFLRFTADEHPRVRANAALALIERNRAEGPETLQKMLLGNEAERTSALWAFSKARPEGFARTAALMAERDPSERVRRKAGELLASA